MLYLGEGEKAKWRNGEKGKRKTEEGKMEKRGKRRNGKPWNII